MKRNVRFLFWAGILLLVCGIWYGNKIFSPAFAIQKSVSICIDKKKDYAELLKQLTFQAHIRSLSLFNRLASAIKYPENIKSGKYELTSHTNYLQALQMLFRGKQIPVRLIFNNIRFKKELVQCIGSQLCLDPEELLNRLNDPAVTRALGFDTATIPVMFIPNTYEMYWDISANELLKRMKWEYDRFWNNKRLKKAHLLSLTPVEISILASIVEEETSLPIEYPVIAGLYINRLKRRMSLQADPTIKFAMGDFLLKRIRMKHLKIDSPYNTYRNYGLPPGPIRIPSVAAIDGVLNYTPHAYIYMCAQEDLSGRHCFSMTWKEHNRNAQKYRAKLNQLNIW